MATDPAFAATVAIGAATIGSAETSLSAPVNAATVLTAGSSGTLVSEVVVEAITTSLAPTTVGGLVYLFVYDGTTYSLYDTLAVTAVTAAATTAPFRVNKTYTNLLLKSGWSLRASQSISGNNSLLRITAFGGDY